MIVGGGPVGLGLAIELGQRGIETTLIEKTRQLHDIPKGQNLTQRTMEHFRFWGVEPEIREARLMPDDYPSVGINAYGSLMGDYAHPWFRRSHVDSFYFATAERLPQYLTEQVLRQRLGRLASVTTRYGESVVDVDLSKEGAVALTDAGARIQSRYLVGCDGAHSTVREKADIAEKRSDHDRRMVLLVFRSRELHHILEGRFGPAAFFNVLDPDLDGYWRFLGRVDVGERWFFHAPVDPASDGDTVDYRALVHESVGAEFAMSLDYVGFWDLRIAIAEDYRDRAVLIAGDAAHSHPPYGGYGINTGLEDARNLGWKLAATLQGWGGDRLIDSYTDERRPVFESTAKDFIERFIANDRDFIRRHDPKRDLADFEMAWKQRGIAAAQEGVSQFEPHYEGSAIVLGPDDGVSGAVGGHTFEPRAGHHLPPPPDGADFFDRLGAGFSLIAASGDAADAFSVTARRLGVPLAVITDHLYGISMLVRPDHYLSWVDTGGDFDPALILRRSIGA